MAVSRIRIVLVALFAVAAGGLALYSHGSSRASVSSDPLAGIPQQGAVLGRPDAPVTVVEYADLQCPYCAYWSRTTFTPVVQNYVRTGKVRLVFRGLAFLGPDSREALDAVRAAGAQNHLWNVVDRLYSIQKAENSGWVTPAVLRIVGRDVEGLDAARMLRDASSPAVAAAILADAHRADADQVRGTPAFEVGRTGERLRPFRPETLNPADFSAELDSLLAG